MMANHNNVGRTTDEQDKLLFHDFLGSKTPTPAPTSSPGGQGRGLSPTSDLVGGRGNHLDGLYMFGSRSEVSNSTTSNRFSGNKRPNSDQDHTEILQWSKLLKNGPGSLPMNANRGGGQIGHLLQHQLSSSRFKDENAGQSQTAADEGSRTGMKVPFTMPNLTSSSTKQMTIFYGGQAHVFDDVHPNKAEVIMALAGSSGGSWSTSLSHKPNTQQNTRDGPYKLDQMYEGGSSRETSFLAPEFRARPSHMFSKGWDTRDPVHETNTGKKPQD